MTKAAQFAAAYVQLAQFQQDHPGLWIPCLQAVQDGETATERGEPATEAFAAAAERHGVSVEMVTDVLSLLMALYEAGA